MRTIKTKSVPTGIFSLWILAISIFTVSSVSNVYASSIQTQPPAKIFAASCSTCHGGKGLGGVTFIKDGPGDNRTAPKIAGKPARYTKAFVRAGSPSGAMPAFGREEITDAELNDLANWLQGYPAGVPAPATPDEPTARRLDILDADPWFWDDNSDTGVSTYSGDRRRVQLDSSIHYLNVVNTGRTWHTLTSAGVGKDSGFIGYAGNYKTTPGDLDQSQGIGYYYADPDTDLASGCHEYYCKMHPYMAVEVCVDEAPGAITRASKDPIDPPPTNGVGEVWVTVQSQEEANETGTTTVNSYNSVNDMDGVYQVINAANFAATPSYIANVGNNPHNAWPGTDGSNNPVVMQANWHDNTVSVMDATAKTLIRERRSGATNAHMMTVPNNSNRFYVTHMGGRAIQELDVDKLIAGFDPNIGGVIRGATGPHGLWFCGDNTHILTADTFGNSATLYNIITKKSKTAGSGGASPLAPSIMSGFSGGCKRGFTNNAGTADVSIYDITGDTITRLVQTAADNGAGLPDYNAAGNIQLRDTSPTTCSIAATGSGVGAACTDPVRWASLPIQTPVSPSDSQHPQYVVTANKASFNVSVTRLGDGKATCLSAVDAGDTCTNNTDNNNGNNTTFLSDGFAKRLYTFPAGLGAHGVTYGKKASCSQDWNDDGTNDSTCYYAYVTNTFEGGRNGVEVLGDSLGDEDGICEAGSVSGEVCTTPTAGYVSVYDLELIGTSSMGTPGSAFTFTLATTTGGFCLSFSGETVYVEGAAAGIVIADLAANGADALTPSGSLGCPSGQIGLILGADGGKDVVQVALAAGLTTATDMDGDGIGPDLRAPITALCPDCRSGVHVGDVPLRNAPGLTSDSTEYTYYKTSVWVDDRSPFYIGSNNLGGAINFAVPDLDLELQINSGGQGIVVRPASTPW